MSDDTTMRADLDALNVEMADVQRQLLDLPGDAFAEKYRLLKRRDALREQAARFATDRDRRRSDEDLLQELAARRTQLAALEGQRVNLVSQSGGGAYGDAAGSMAWGGVQLNAEIDKSLGVGEVSARIGVLKGILTERSVEIPSR